MPVWVADQKTLTESQVLAWETDDSGRNGRKLTIARCLCRRSKVLSEYPSLPVRDVVGLSVDQHRTSISRRQVFQELDARPGLRAQGSDAQPSSEHIVK